VKIGKGYVFCDVLINTNKQSGKHKLAVGRVDCSLTVGGLVDLVTGLWA